MSEIIKRILSFWLEERDREDVLLGRVGRGNEGRVGTWVI